MKLMTRYGRIDQSYGVIPRIRHPMRLRALRIRSLLSPFNTLDYRPFFQLNSINRIVRNLSSNNKKIFEMPVIPIKADPEVIEEIINTNEFVIFSKSFCPFSKKLKELFSAKKLTPAIFELDQIESGNQIQSILYTLTGQNTVPSVFAHGNHMGGCDDVLLLEKENKLETALSVYKERLKISKMDDSNFDFDLAVIGGGSGGISCAKEFSEAGKRVVLFDYVSPSPMNTKWGLGGTCVNVGCIPKKLMHQAAIHGHNIKKSKFFGFSVPEDSVKHDWFEMCGNIHSYIKSLNFGYRSALQTKGIKYINSLAKISGMHEITYKNSKKVEEKLKTRYIVVATGERPQYPDIPGAEYCITSDDFFWLKYYPKKTLVIGASYVALECAGALHGMGIDVTIMVRSIFLRGYDKEFASRVGEFMEKDEKIRMLKEFIPVKVECLEKPDPQTKNPGLLKVHYKATQGSDEIFTEEFNTVLFAIGRVSCTKGIGLEDVGIPLDSRNRVISIDNREQTVCPSVFAIGDILSKRPQLTTVAIKAGLFLAKRLAKVGFDNTDYTLVPTTVFTPLEYGAVGYSEEDAIDRFGDDDIDVYINFCEPLEEALVENTNHTAYYAKLICRRSMKNKVIGLHILSPNAGEIIQGYAVALQSGATLFEFKKTFGIHPTISEVFINMKVTKKSKISVVPGGC